MIADKVLIDTSIWIEYFRDRLPQITEQVDEILSRDGAYIPNVVIAELIQGAHSEKEIAVIESFVDAFHIIDQTESTWAKAGRLSFDLKKQGKTVHLVDCYIAIIAHEHQCRVFTTDSHFKDIEKVIGLSLIYTIE